MTTDAGIVEKCAAVIVLDRRLLVVRKRGTKIFISPGGKVAPGESQIECLRREIKEELDADLIRAEPFGTYERPSALEKGIVRIHAWLATIAGECVPCAEIDELRWITATEEVPLGSVFAECVIPALVQNGHLSA
jgi:8-oxo-dGTP diphosphatase